MSKYVKILATFTVILSFCVLCIGFASLQDTLFVDGTLSYKPPEAILISGPEFQAELDKLTNVETITFEVLDSYETGVLSDGFDIAGAEFVADVDEGKRGFVKLYKRERTGTLYDCNSSGDKIVAQAEATLTDVYVVSNMGKIYANPNCSEMFCKRYCLSSIKFGENAFDTSKVTNMTSMFNSCRTLVELDLSGFDTTNVTTMLYMFVACKLLENLNVSSFKTPEVVNMEQMFSDCYKLKSLDLSGFDTTKVTTMASMFHYCKVIKKLDLSSFNTENVTNMECMFEGCFQLGRVYVSPYDAERKKGWTVANVTASARMFMGVDNLYGGSGTKTAWPWTADAAYAHIDDPPDNPGYFTDIKDKPN